MGIRKSKHICIYRSKLWDMTHQAILGFVPLIILCCASLSVALGYKWFFPAINTNLARLKTYSMLVRHSGGWILISGCCLQYVIF